ncbi:MAG: DNA-3-methyladenine glycosylase [Bacteroidales bacterium]|jgi:DNA-3-methyladenine glycosylase|nr:DNA-3-methyladenine glycosylase [Bacteroidales bacterium]
MIRLNAEIYSRNAIQLAPFLIGKVLCRNTCEGVKRLTITETEAYYGYDDTASHAHKGITPRNAPMFQKGGITYVYLCYGMHNMLNIVSGEANHPEAVLIRGVEGYEGPGKLTKYLNITRQQNALSLIDSNELWIEDTGTKPQFTTLKRIGIDYAEEKDRERLWRFHIA